MDDIYLGEDSTSNMNRIGCPQPRELPSQITRFLCPCRFKVNKCYVWLSEQVFYRISVTPLRPGMGSSEEIGEIELFLGDLPAQLLGRRD